MNAVNGWIDNASKPADVVRGVSRAYLIAKIHKRTAAIKQQDE